MKFNDQANGMIAYWYGTSCMWVPLDDIDITLLVGVWALFEMIQPPCGCGVLTCTCISAFLSSGSNTL
ncbi:hypothetical protein PanWU01x14_101000 [Parasponia andersonii]|uniref:Uncharacterized protein n=1 Tax=Parasponia andersonii TaxID=3476 RepID=A0A2P5D2Z8_PARAD|nr:hypothetical protein PanWU01x14_101000 [Parasponia andersonii]